MRINIVTLFPEYFTGPFSCGMMQRARDAGIIDLHLCNPRDMATDRHHTVDDRPYGGGPGMLMQPGPVARMLRSLGYRERGKDQPGRLIFLSPKGVPFSQALAGELARELTGERARELTGELAKERARELAGHTMASVDPAIPEALCDTIKPQTAVHPRMLTLVCGRYEGLDARIEEIFPMESVSLGDFVLNGGEAGAVCLVEAVARLLPGFMGHEESGEEESFSKGLLEYPQYTRPEEFEGVLVPEVLRSGDHGKIALWRRQMSLAQTLESRPDLLDEAALVAADRAFLRTRQVERLGRNLYCALVHHPVLDKMGNSVTVSLTNLDIHDIARSSYTYCLAGYYVVTPVEDQQELLQSILSHWSGGPGKRSNPDRDKALSLVRGERSLDDALADIRVRTGQDPFVIKTTANPDGDSGKNDLPAFSFAGIADMLRRRPVLLLFGTGHGLAPEVNAVCHAFAPALRWHSGYNHLSVRSAAAIILDRILGDWR